MRVLVDSQNNEIYAAIGWVLEDALARLARFYKCI
jgi:archaellum component FlaD/FlaE